MKNKIIKQIKTALDNDDAEKVEALCNEHFFIDGEETNEEFIKEFENETGHPVFRAKRAMDGTRVGWIAYTGKGLFYYG